MRGNVDKSAPQHSGSTAYINARIIDPVGDAEYRGAVLISDGKIADFGPNLFASGAPYGIESVDCRGLYLAPGLVDTRVHTGEPGEGDQHRGRQLHGTRQGLIARGRSHRSSPP